MMASQYSNDWWSVIATRSISARLAASTISAEQLPSAWTCRLTLNHRLPTGCSSASDFMKSSVVVLKVAFLRFQTQDYQSGSCVVKHVGSAREEGKKGGATMGKGDGKAASTLNLEP